ncbi:MAG: PD-(D/E)XK nuclease family protein [Actinomycetota bacterium]|nr:MAG: PD-(D/E)XK nuclease family protein [Actinomycetota bacterium]
MTCPLLYRFRVVDRLPERPSPAAVRGTVVHAVLESLFDLPPADRTLQRAIDLVPQAWERVAAEQPDLAELLFADPAVRRTPVAADDESGGSDAGGGGPAGGERAAGDAGGGDSAGGESAGGAAELRDWLDSMAPLLTTYFELEDPTRLEPAEREMRVEIELESGLVLRGFVDRLDVAPSGELRVVDYKTGRAPGQGFEAKAMFQMRVYGLALWRTTGRVPRMLQLLYLGSGEVLRYAPDEAELRATERKLDAIWAAIERSMRTGDWRPSPSRLCSWCDHQAHCPAFGGTPPDLPSVTTTDVLSADDVLTLRAVERASGGVG